jgi:hypothetical protein
VRYVRSEQIPESLVQVERAVRPSSPLLIRGFGVRVPGGAPAHLRTCELAHLRNMIIGPVSFRRVVSPGNSGTGWDRSLRPRISHPMNVTTIHTADPGPGEHLSPGVAGDVGVLMEAVSSSLVLSGHLSHRRTGRPQA